MRAASERVAVTEVVEYSWQELDDTGETCGRRLADSVGFSCNRIHERDLARADEGGIERPVGIVRHPDVARCVPGDELSRDEVVPLDAVTDVTQPHLVGVRRCI